MERGSGPFFRAKSNPKRKRGREERRFPSLTLRVTIATTFLAKWHCPTSIPSIQDLAKQGDIKETKGNTIHYLKYLKEIR